MDFLDDPAATHWCRLIISRAKQDEVPNELSNPEILMKNHHKSTHSFGLVFPTIFPDTDISSCVCIILLFETSSSSHIALWSKFFEPFKSVRGIKRYYQSKVDDPHIIMDVRCSPMHPLRYVQPAVNRQPGLPLGELVEQVCLQIQSKSEKMRFAHLWRTFPWT